MIDFLLATAISCSESQELVDKIMNKSNETVSYKHELIEVIKTNTEPGCYEGSESST